MPWNEIQMKFLYREGFLPLAFLWHLAQLKKTNLAESHHEQASYRYYRFANCFIDARFSNARARFPPEVSRHSRRIEEYARQPRASSRPIYRSGKPELERYWPGSMGPAVIPKPLNQVKARISDVL